MRVTRVENILDLRVRGATAIAALLLLLTLLLLLGACDRAAPTPPRSERVKVLATVLPLADIVREIGGPYVQVEWIVESGQSVAGVQTTADLRNRLRSADLVVSGGVTEPWAVEGYDDPFRAQRIVRLDLLGSVRDMEVGGWLWLDPTVVEDLARELQVKLSVMRPLHESVFAQRRDDFIARLESVVRPHDQALAAAPNKKLLVLGTDFDPLLKRFGLSAVLVAGTNVTELSDHKLAVLKQVSRQNDTRVLLLGADTPHVVVRDLESRSGLRVVLLDALGSSAGEGRSSYLDVLRFNLEQLARATGAAD
jgi:zinc transport system substrate-binding protein